MLYDFKYRRGWFWKTLKVMGHNLEKDNDKMIVYFQDGSLYGIHKWSECDLRLGTDWFTQRKKEMEVAAGQKIPMNIKEVKENG